MMVNNEAHHLQRIYDEIGKRIDAVVIGVTPPYEDDSVEVAMSVFSDKKSNTFTMEGPDTLGYGPARQITTDAARAMGCDYVILLDPYDSFVGHIPNRLDGSYYMIQHKTWDEVNYKSVHMVHKDYPLKWHGRVHELINTWKPEQAVDTLKTCHVYREKAGATVERGLTQYIPMLLKDHEDDPTEARTVFYLAQSYLMVGDLKNAAEWYAKRLGMEGFIEEEYYSLYKLGCIAREQGNNEDAERWLMRAHIFRPIRREALRELISLYGQFGSIELAHTIFEWYQQIKPCEDVLAVEDGKRE